ncbi:MAG: hypothetical protein ACON4R_11620 [Akkermansiaceae bacterium]
MANRRNSGPFRPRSSGRRRGLPGGLLGLHQLARNQVNRRGGRRLNMTRQSAIAGSATAADYYEEEDFLSRSFLKRLFHWAIGIFLIPLCFITVITLIKESGEDRILETIWYSTNLVCFVAGALLMLSWFVLGIANDQLLYLYVLGHEMTHAMFVYVCGGRISAIHFSTEGGYVMTNKSNILIALSPYFIPFWSAVLISLHGFISLWADIPGGGLILTGLIGFTWTFHIVWTVWMIPKDQPDLKENGTFLSLMLIIFANLILFSLILCATSHEVQLLSFVFEWWNTCLDLGQGLLRLI